METTLLSPGGVSDRVVSVSELNRLARQALESRFPLMWVGGEISNVTYAASGHLYFSLKDADAQVRCTLWRSRAQLLDFALDRGMQVEVRALVTLYEARGEYQLSVETVRRAGVGALYEAFARLKEQLQRQGLFDPARKRPLPAFPNCIGLVTSLHAAALRDVLAALQRRAPAVPVIIYPAPVQGSGAAEQLAAALQAAAAGGECDVLIVCRGGGSIEDLWAFNEEVLARAIAASPVPVVSGVGHETDFTIADYVADQRAATPTAAAELVSAGYVTARSEVSRLAAQFHRGMRRRLENQQQRVDLASRGMVSPKERLARMEVSIDHARSRLTSTMARALDQTRAHLARGRLQWRHAKPRLAPLEQRMQHLAGVLRTLPPATVGKHRTRIQTLGEHLAMLDPRKVLGRGYSIVRDSGGKVVRDSLQAPAGSTVSLEFARGSALATVTRNDRGGGNEVE
ncbi:MAG: exodeoxyribonuclease VII large subunit [Rhodocyclaceae bacterium]